MRSRVIHSFQRAIHASIRPDSLSSTYQSTRREYGTRRIGLWGLNTTKHLTPSCSRATAGASGCSLTSSTPTSYPVASNINQHFISRSSSLLPASGLQYRHYGLFSRYSKTPSTTLPQCQRRWKTDQSTEHTTREASTQSTKAEQTGVPPESPPPTNSISERVTERAHQIEERVKQVVQDLTVGDQVTVLVIVTLFALILSGPIVLRYRQRRREESHLTDDSVDELAALLDSVRKAEDNEQSQSSAVVHSILRDVLNNQGLQRAAQEFVLRLFQSEEVQAALRRLVAQQFQDLVNDPETLVQIRRLLQLALQDTHVIEAAKQLVLQIVEDEQVKQAVLQLVDKVAKTESVKASTQAVLTNAAQGALTDPAILEQSRSLATDVVGDDVVQRTAGEALRTAVRHAVTPVVVLGSIGLSLLATSLIAWRVAHHRGSTGSRDMGRGSDEDASRLVQESVTVLAKEGHELVSRFLDWPMQMTVLAGNAALELCTISLQWMSTHGQNLLVATGERLTQLPMYIASGIRIASIQASKATGRSILSGAFSLLVSLYQGVVQGARLGAYWLLELLTTSSTKAGIVLGTMKQSISRGWTNADDAILNWYDMLVQVLSSYWRILMEQFRNPSTSGV